MEAVKIDNFIKLYQRKQKKLAGNVICFSGLIPIEILKEFFCHLLLQCWEIFLKILKWFHTKTRRLKNSSRIFGRIPTKKADGINMLYCFFRILTGFVCCKKCVGDQEPMDSLELGFQVKNGNYNVGFQNNEDKLWNYNSKYNMCGSSIIMRRFLSFVQKFKQ